MLKKQIAKAGIVVIIGMLSSIATLVVAECVKNSSEALSKAKSADKSGQDENDRRCNNVRGSKLSYFLLLF